ncbi:hypothetical protein QR97_07225 [Streptomyces sp. PBH53]|uniref:hypothetical protein n=1 Tax=Streptomyces sp. PBH53 TaxID=1577075 RepID=UPI0006557D6F|nr:hypothetical protein [Streptomyces sp. PBH53]AKN69650.1 hypothetical protein QR97_07225 [Streptomyces sp. PBH53]
MVLMAAREVMDGAEVFEPDRDGTGANLPSYVEDWKPATGSRSLRGFGDSCCPVIDGVRTGRS